MSQISEEFLPLIIAVGFMLLALGALYIINDAMKDIKDILNERLPPASNTNSTDFTHKSSMSMSNS